jgi:oxygen-independent coproporphyrinogen-3 oxidase
LLLYIHIPFCDSKCNYCAFNSYTSLHYLKEEYINALSKQLVFELKKLQNTKIQTLFIGGGTPSALDIKYYENIFNILNIYLDSTVEITIEANPNSATLHWLEGIKKLGINRISFGVQSFNDKKLDFLGRNHTASMAIKAVDNAYDIGFEHINCDIIYDTSIDTKRLLDEDLKIIQTLPIDHISAYSLTIEDGTKFYNKTDVKVDDEKMARYLFQQLKHQGFNQYEISNFSKNEKSRSKHNLGYWEYKEYLGVGAGAVGCIDNQRLYSQKDLYKYIQNPIDYEYIEELSSQDIKMEKILLGFRCIVGVDKNILNTKELEKAYKLESSGKLRFDDERFYATDFLIADELALYVF